MERSCVVRSRPRGGGASHELEMGFITGIKVALGGRPTIRDPHEVDQEAARIKAAIERSDLSECVELLRQQRGGAWEDRHFYCEVVARNADVAALDTLCAADRRNAIAHLLRAAKGITMAWEARRSSDTLTSHSWADFREHIEHARGLLEVAARLDPVDPTPHVYMLEVARGLQLPAEEAYEHFKKAVARDRLHFPAHAAMVEVLSPTWGGNNEDMFDFARSAVQGAPEGTEVWLVLLLANIERWHYTYSMEGETEAATALVADPAVQEEVMQAYRNSLLSDWHVPGRYTPRRRNEMAFWFHLTGERSRLKYELSRLGPICTDAPWSHLGEPREVFRAARKSAGLS